METSPQSSPPTGPFRCLQLLSTGAGGMVWRAEGPAGPVALKVAQSESQQVALRHEAAILDWVDHPNVIRKVQAHPSGTWLALEYVEGAALKEWARGKGVTRIVEVAARLAEGLAHLHGNGIAHGDLKPSNVVIDDQDRPRIIDLGIARLVEDEPPPAGFRGTLGFAAPEVLAGRPPGFATDLWSFGALVYAMLTGHPPFADRDPAALTYLPLSSLPEPVSALSPGLPKALDELVMGLLARQPDARPGPASTLPEALRASLRSPPQPILVGMRREREALRGLVVAAQQGEGSVVVLHGPDGSGRRTLAAEVQSAARREGFVRLSLGERPRELLPELRAAPQPTLVVTESRDRGVIELASRVLAERLRCLLVIVTDRPMVTLGKLGAQHMQPPALGLDQVRQLLSALHRPMDQAEGLLSASKGNPGALVALLSDPVREIVGLTEPERALLQLTARGPMTIEALAKQLTLGEHALIDLAEPLLDRGLIVELDDGERLAASLMR
ncbi:MAG: protein kinase [Deltaproteobacteria bacterium]|nr:protein kinase [Deltaproteobacteria bacterium]